MIHCPNKSHPDWKKLVENTGSENEAYKEYIINNFTIPIDGEPSKGVKYVLKGVDILLSDRAKQVFAKGEKAGWDLNKILTELQVPKEQKQLILDLGITNREQLALELASNYSYSVEINTAKEKTIGSDNSTYTINGIQYVKFGENDYRKRTENSQFEKISQKEFVDNQNKPTQHYSYLTVPGGTNYTENEISTPLITPSIKGHAQFSTDKGIGWFRSDEQAIVLSAQDAASSNKGNLTPFDNDYGKIPTKTRRILELQSDLFQKGRDKEDLVTKTGSFDTQGSYDNVFANGYFYTRKYYGTDENNIYYRSGEEISKEQYYEEIDDSKKINPNTKENQFLQLLNKDNNWVTFFVKSIIQDSAKKGYEKVLFPRLDTIIQIESQNRFKTYKEAEAHYKNEKWQLEDEELRKTLREYQQEFEDRKIAKKDTKEVEQAIINQKERIRSHQPTLLNTANFYEYELANRLDDIAGGNKNNRAKGIWALNQITDEFGNAWNEVNITEKELGTIMFQKQSSLPFDAAVQEFKDKYRIKGSFMGMKEINKILKEARDNSKYDQIEFGIESTPYSNTITYNRKYPQQTKLFQKQQAAQQVAPNMELDTAVLNYFEALGIKLDFVKEIYHNGKLIDAIAKADALLGLVEVIEGKRKVDTLSEEAAHIWVEMAGGENNPMILKMMNDVTQYKIYQDVVRDYSKIYKGNENLLKKEAVGKVIASHMVKRFTGEPALDEIAGNWFQRLWQKIKSFFVGNKYKTASLEILTMTKEKADKLKAEGAKYNAPQSADMFQLNEETQSEEILEEEENVHKTQYVFFKRRLAFLEAKVKEMPYGDPKTDRYEQEIAELKELFKEATETSDYEILGRRVLENTEKFINRLENNEISLDAENLEYTFDTIKAFRDYTSLATEARLLEQRLFPFVLKMGIEEINNYATEGFPITEEMVNKQIEDVLTIVAQTGALANSSNYIVRTVASIVKAAQNRISVKNKHLTHDVQQEIDKLKAYGQKHGMTLEQVYDLFVEEKTYDYEGNTVTKLALISKKIKGKDNPKWLKINSSPELKHFYIWYQQQTGIAGKEMGALMSWDFIPNVKKKKNIIEKWKAEDLETEEFQTGLQEELFADVVSNKAYKTNLKAEDKSKDLGEAILKYRAFAIKQSEMAEVLPKTRILQKMLEIKRTKSGAVVERTFTKANDKKTSVLGKNSQRWKMVDAYIEMQVKGRMKGENQTKASKAADQLMAYNSLLRIGLSPITAVSNIVFGELSNFIEGVGGRFYTNAELRKAHSIFAKETMDANSKTNLLLELFNPLQEMTDYENINKVRIAKKYSPEKLKELMYSPQKMGEKLLQTSTMIANMLHTKIKSIDGKTEISLWEAFEVVKDEQGKANIQIKEGFEFSEKQMSQLTDKIQRLNEMIHGRYSSRDAAIASQNVLYRMVSQFRKWIPTQVENRIMKKQYDNRLGVFIEGRYLTFRDSVLKKAFKEKQFGKAFYNMVMPLISAKKALEEGNMTELEVYNLRKMMVEIIVAAGTLLLLALASGGDDDDKMKDPLVKFGLTLLNRASSDLTFFYSATEINNLGKNALPISKTMGDILDAVFIIPEVMWTEEYVITRGSNKGRYKIEKEFVDVVPILNPIFGQMRRIFSDNKLEELN